MGLLFFLAGYIVFYRLGGSFLENWDEAWYGDVVRNMLRTKELIVPHWNQRPFIDKPPFFMWVAALASAIFGLSEFSLRLPSAISALILIIWVTVYCYRHDGLVPSLLAFSALALNNIFIWRARSGNIDTLVALEIFMAFFLILSKSRWRFPVLGILLAVIYLTKASLVFFPVAILLIYELSFERKSLKKNLPGYLALFLSFVTISGAWLVLGSLKVGWGLARYYLFHSDQGAANINLQNFNSNYIKYAYYSLQRRFFWVLIFGFFLALFKVKERRFLLLVLFSSLLLLVISFGRKDNNWYLVPLMPFWSILVSFGAAKFINFFGHFKLKYLVVLGVLGLSFYVSYKTFSVNIRSVMASQTTLNQARASILLNKIAGEGERIVRLDHLYPATIYYADRFVYSSDTSAWTGGFFLSRADLQTKIKAGEIRWIIGKEPDIKSFSDKLPKDSWQIIATEADEQILKVGLSNVEVE